MTESDIIYWVMNQNIFKKDSKCQNCTEKMTLTKTYRNKDGLA